MAAEQFAALPDREEATKTEAELRFSQGEYGAVARLLDWVPAASAKGFNSDANLWLVIAECRLDHPERALPLLAPWRAQEYCETGKILEADLPVEISGDVRSVEATAWLILAYHREASGRPALPGYLEAQRLAPRSSAVAARLLEVGLAQGDFALARHSLPLTATSKTPCVRRYQATMAATIDRLERLAKGAKATAKP